MKSRVIMQPQVIKSRSVASIYANLENNSFIYTDFPQAFLSLNKSDWYFCRIILVSFVLLKGKRLVLSQRIQPSLFAPPPFSITDLHFFRKHCTLSTTLEIGKIYSNHLHFLSYLLKCSEPLNLKIFWGSMPPDPRTFEHLWPSIFFPLRTPSKSHATPLKSLQISKTCFSQQF